MVLESWPVAIDRAIREGTLALIRPVTTLTDGRCVAMTRWMPTARAIWAMRTMAPSMSRGATIIRSASSSMTHMMYGRGSSPFGASSTGSPSSRTSVSSSGPATAATACAANSSGVGAPSGSSSPAAAASLKRSMLRWP